MLNNDITSTKLFKVFDELLTTVGVIGIESTVKHLQDAKKEGMLMQNNSIASIFSIVCKVTNVTKDRIIRGNDRKTDDRKIALACAIFFIKNECELTFRDLKNIFFRHESVLNRYYALVEEMPDKPKTEFDKKLDETIKKIKSLLIQKKVKNG